MSEKLFKIWVKNDRTGEAIAFFGQGTTVKEAVDDGVKSIQASYRPSSSGNAKPGAGLGVPSRVGVVLPDGRRVLRHLKDFEGDEPYSAEKEEKKSAEAAPRDPTVTADEELAL